MKRLLMATDLSARSDRALERAVALAHEHGAQLKIVHVVDQDLPAVLATAQQTAADEIIRDQIAAVTAGNDPSISVEIVLGRAYVDILAMSEKFESELIVVGVHREHSFKDMFRGTTVERVIRAGTVPVLLVKDRVSGPYHRIMVGVDFSVYSRRAIEFAISFAPSGEFYLVHAYEVPFKGFLYGDGTRRQVVQRHQLQFKQMLDEELGTFLANFGDKARKIKCVMQEGPVLEVIQRQKNQLNPDLLVVGTHGRTGVAHAFLGSVAEDLLRNPPCDVVAVKAW